MSQNRKLTSLVSVVALFGLAGLLSAACGNKDGEGGTSCGEIGARVEALNASAANLTSVAAGIKTRVVGACATLADMPAPGAPTDADVTTICTVAQNRLDAALTGDVTLTIVPPVCTVDAEAQFSCEADCYAEAEVMCEPGEVDVRCDPAELSVECMGTCNVNAQCEGTAPSVAVDCQGKCEGSCTGTCTGRCTGTCSGACSAMGADGQCNGNCTGTCTGECETSCMGTCKGSCTVTQTGGVSCGAMARCKGGCTGDFRAPRCEANLRPPACEASANVDCSADCQSSASLKAQCTEPSITVVGNVDVAVRDDIVAALPVLLQVSGQADLGLRAVEKLAADFGSVAVDVGSCALEVGASAAAAFSGAVTATAQASASVSVSFKASAEVSGSATSG